MDFLTPKEKTVIAESIISILVCNIDAASDCLNKKTNKELWRDEDAIGYLLECAEQLLILQKLEVKDINSRILNQMGFNI